MGRQSTAVRRLRSSSHEGKAESTWSPCPDNSPELNPVELLWSQLKRGLKNQVFLNLADLAEALVEKIEEIRKDTELLVSFFKKKEIAFFTN